MSIKIAPPGPATALSGAGAGSVSAHAVVAAPAANTAIASIAPGSLVTGQRYQLDVYTYVAGAQASPADDDNMSINVNGVVIVFTVWNGASGGGAPPVRTSVVTKPLDGVNAIQVRSVGAATAATNYHATIVATPVGD